MKAKVCHLPRTMRPYYFLAEDACVLLIYQILDDYDCNAYLSQNLKYQGTISSYSEL
jgi:hypothetical protein